MDEGVIDMVTTLMGGAKSSTAAVNKKYPPHLARLNDKYADKSGTFYTKADLEKGFKVTERIEMEKFRSLVLQVERDIPALMKMTEENRNTYLEAVKAFLKNRPDHPAIAALAQPNKDQVLFAVIMAAFAPESAGVVFDALAKNQLLEQEQQQQLNDIEFEGELQRLDLELGFTQSEFELEELTLGEEIGELRGTEAEKREDDVVEQEHQNRLKEIEAANKVKFSQQENALMIELLRGMRDKSRTPASTRILAEQFGFSPEAVDALVGDEEKRFTLELEETMSEITKNLASAGLSDVRAEEIETLLPEKVAEIRQKIEASKSLAGLNDQRKEALAKEMTLMDFEAQTRRMNAAASYHNAFKAASEDPDDKQKKADWNKLRVDRISKLLEDEGNSSAEIRRLEGMLEGDGTSFTLSSDQTNAIKVALAAEKKRLEGIEETQGHLNADLNTILGISDPAISSPSRGARVGG